MSLAFDEYGRPFIILREQGRKQRIRGVEAVKANILAAKTVSRTLRSSLGPKGMDKMLQSPDGEVTISEPGLLGAPGAAGAAGRGRVCGAGVARTAAGRLGGCAPPGCTPGGGGAARRAARRRPSRPRLRPRAASAPAAAPALP
jgi:hypothetical protein